MERYQNTISLIFMKHVHIFVPVLRVVSRLVSSNRNAAVVGPISSLATRWNELFLKISVLRWHSLQPQTTEAANVRRRHRMLLSKGELRVKRRHRLCCHLLIREELRRLAGGMYRDICCADKLLSRYGSSGSCADVSYRGIIRVTKTSRVI